MAVTKFSMAEASSGAIYHPTINHRLSPDSIVKLMTFAPWAWNASTEN